MCYYVLNKNVSFVQKKSLETTFKVEINRRLGICKNFQ